MKFSDIANLYMREKRLEGVKASTLSNYTYTIENLFIPFLSANFDVPMLYALVENISSKVARKTAIDKVNLLNNILHFAYRKQLIQNEITMPVPKQSRHKVEIFSDAEQKALRSYILNHLDYYHFGVLLALCTGVRIGELAALQNRHVMGGVLQIKNTLQRIKNLDPNAGGKTVLVTDTPKTEASVREIPLVSQLQTLFQRLYYGLPDNAYIMTGTLKPAEPRTIEKRFKSLLLSSGIPYKVFHTLRHTFATNSIQSGMDVKTLAELLGHANVSITLTRYVHPDMELKRNALEIFTDREGP